MSKVNDHSVGFAQGTAVLMADGRLKPIENIKPGEWVMSFDITSPDSLLEPRQVIDTIDYISRDVMEVVSGDDAILVGCGQLFLTPGMDWHFAHETAFITDVDGNARDFTVTKANQGKYRIHDIIVDDNHSLVANGFRVHNPDSGFTAGGGAGSTGIGATHGGQGRTPGSSQTVNSFTRGATERSESTSKGGNQARGSFGFTNGDEGGFHTGVGGGGGGGGGDRQSVQIRSSRNTKAKSPKENPPPPAPDKKVVAYSAYSAIADTMDYICDIMLQATSTNFFTVRTAANRYTEYARALAADAIANINLSDIGAADKANLITRDADLVNGFRIIEDAFKVDPNQISANITSIERACLNNKMWVDTQQNVIGKYIGNGKSNYTYTLPGFTPPPKVNLPNTPSTKTYVQTAPSTYTTSTTSQTGTTYARETTGGLGASFTKTRVVRGFLYSYSPGKGWTKIGPADQIRNIGNQL